MGCGVYSYATLEAFNSGLGSLSPEPASWHIESPKQLPTACKQPRAAAVPWPWPVCGTQLQARFGFQLRRPVDRRTLTSVVWEEDRFKPGFSFEVGAGRFGCRICRCLKLPVP